jgi:hypothetical protein
LLQCLQRVPEHGAQVQAARGLIQCSESLHIIGIEVEKLPHQSLRDLSR